MSIKTSILIEADSKQAKTEIEAVERAIKKTGTATEELGRKARTGATGTKELGGAAGQAEAKVESLAAAERRAAVAANEMDRSNRRASAATANLVAQGNDIFVMLAAGQDPMQLALQQGTQINQVFAQLGGGMGALRGVGSAIMAMVSPMSLLTIGAIAGVSALTNWGMAALSAGEDAMTYEDQIDHLSATIATYASNSGIASQSTAELSQNFGRLAGDMGPVAAFLAQIAKVDALRELDAAVQSIAERFGGLSRTDLVSTQFGITPEIVDTAYDLRDALGLTNEQANAVTLELERLANVNSLEDKVFAANAFNDKLIELFGSIEKVPAALLDVAREAANLALQAGEIEGVGSGIARAMDEAVEGWRKYQAAQADAHAASVQSGNEILSQLESEIALLTEIAASGSDSAAVAALRAEQERIAFEAMLETKEIAGDLKDEIMASYDAKVAVAGVDITSGISSAANEAARLAQNMILAARMAARPGQTADLADEDAAMAVSVLPGEAGRDRNNNAVDKLIRITTPKAVRASGGGGGKSDAEKARDDAIKAAEREQKAVDSLIESLQQEVDLQRLLSPIQQEMRRHRDTLASATSAERAEVEKLITMREAEATAMAAAKEQMDFFKSSGFELFDDLTDDAGGFGDSLESIADRIRRIAFEALLLGEGPLAGLLGGGNAAAGGLLGMASQALFPGLSATAVGDILPKNVLGDGSLYADGGLIHGPGGGRSDDVPIWASSGEFMMNAKATSQHRHLLEAMNAGAQLPGFATGGAIDGSRAASMMAPQVTFIDQSTGSKTITREDSVDAQGRPQTKFALADAVGQALSTPGGGAQRVLTQGFGVRRRGSKR